MREMTWEQFEEFVAPLFEAAGLVSDAGQITALEVDVGGRCIDVTVVDPYGEPWDKITRRVFWSTPKGESE